MALQTKTYSTGSFAYQSASNGYVLDLILTELSTDVQANTSQIAYKLQLRSGPNNRFDWQIESGLQLNGQQVAQASAERYLDYNAAWVLLEGEATVPHTEDGAGELTFGATIRPWNGGTQYTPPAMTLTGQLLLTAIPRASAIAATDAAIGDTATVVVSRKSANYQHSIRYRFGTLSGYLADSTGTLSEEETLLSATTVLFPIPVSFYDQIPDAPSGICQLTCTTYAQGEPIGAPQTAELTITADPARCAPVVHGTVEDVNPVTLALTGSAQTLVQGESRVRCTPSVTARCGAAITRVLLNGVQIPNAPQTGSAVAEYTLRAEDSRGYAAQYTVSGLTVIPYVPVSATARATRDDPTSGNATLMVTGKWFSGTFGAKSNTLTCRYRVGSGDWTDIQAVTQGENFSVQVQLTGLDYQSAHTIEVQVADALEILSKTVTLGRGMPVFDWGEQDFAFHVPVTFTASDGRVFRLDLSDGQLTAIII